MKVDFPSLKSGIVHSKYDWSGYYDMDNVDLYTELETARCTLGLVKESSTTITEPVIGCITRSGRIYWFSSTSGKIWNRETNGTYGSVTANPYGAHYGAKFFDNWVYFWSINKISRMADGGTSRTDDKEDFPDDTAYHPCAIQNGKLWIGDGHKLCSLDTSGGYVSAKISLEARQNMSHLIPFGYDLAILTLVSASNLNAGCFRYDCASISTSGEDYLDEAGVNYAIPSNDTDKIFIIAGNNGNVYEYNGVSFAFRNRIKNVTTSYNRWAMGSYQRRSLFAIGGTVYSLLLLEANSYPVLNKEFVCSAGSSATIYSIVGTATGLYISWGLSGTYGVDKIDTNYATAVIKTPLIEGAVKNIEVPYESLPTGCTISIATNEDGAGTYTARDCVVDTVHKIVTLKASPGHKRTLQAQITLTPSGATTPIIQKPRLIQKADERKNY